MSNVIADQLADLLAQAGLVEVRVTLQHDLSRRMEPDFVTRAGIWAEVAASRGHQMVQDGVLTEEQRVAAETEYRAWLRQETESHRQYLLAVEGVRPL